MKNKQSEIKNELTKTSAKVYWACPVSTNSRYRLIDGFCYYFEATAMNYSTAETNCKNKFGPLYKGKLLEPRSVSLNNKIYKNAQEVLNPGGAYEYWIGVTDRRTEGRHSYNSDVGDANVNLGIWLSGEPNNIGTAGDGDCILLQSSKWFDSSCTRQETSVCEIE